MFSEEAVPLELCIWGAGGMLWEVMVCGGGEWGDSGPGGRCHDDDMGLDRWGAVNDE